MVIHILKDGTKPKDITGHVVKYEDAKTVYQLISNINSKKWGLIMERFFKILTVIGASMVFGGIGANDIGFSSLPVAVSIAFAGLGIFTIGLRGLKIL